MAHVIEVVIQGRDNTGPAFAAARANIAGLGTVAQDRARFAAIGAGTQLTNAQAATRARAEIAATARIESAEKTANARIVAAQLAGNARVEAERIRAANRVHLLERRQAAQGAVLPRSVASFGAGAIGQIGVATGAAVLGQQLITLAQESVRVSVQADRIGVAYEQATAKAGVSADALMTKLKDASRDTITTTDLQLNANRALSLGVGESLQDIADLLSIARQRGKMFGIDTQEAFERIVLGLGKAEPEILDELGILIDSNAVYKEYAKSIGVAANELTKKQKIAAVTNHVLRENTALVQQNAKEEVDAADRIAQAQVKRQEAERRFGEQITPLYTAALEKIGGMAETITGGNAGVNGSSAQGFVSNLIQKTSSYEDYQQQRRAFINENNTLSSPGRLMAATQVSSIKLTEEEYQQRKRAEAQGSSRGRGMGTAGATAPTSMTLPPQAAGFAGFSPGANVYVTVQGNVTTQEDLTDAVHRGLQAKAQQNGYQSGVIR